MREYNLKWNFFESHSDADLERQFAADRVWGRPTQPFRETAQPRHPAARRGPRLAALRLRRPDGAARRQGDAEPRRERVAARPQRRLPATERRALEILEAQDSQTKTEIRQQYKALVKDLHPDMNGGRRDDEARLAEVVWAWEQIKASRSFRD